MPHDLMTQCEQKKLFIVDGKEVARWTSTPVSKLFGATSPNIRCIHCNGAVRVHKQQVDHGPQDHVEHRSRQDSEHCKGGSYFKGVHRRSTAPVV